MRAHAAAAAAAILLAACAGDDASPPAARRASSTSFLALVDLDGRPRIYLPAQPSDRSPIAVVDAMAAHGTVGLLRYLELPAGSEPIAMGADGDHLVVVDSANPVIHFLSISSETVVATADLPAGAERFPVSGTALYSMGVAVDADRGRAWAAWTGGIAEYDVRTHALTATIDVPAAENFAYDGTILYLPFYLIDATGAMLGPACAVDPLPECPAVTDGLTLVDVASRTRYQYVDPAAASPRAPLGFEPDASALDPSLGMFVVVVEDPPALWVFDGAATRFDAGAGTCVSGRSIAVPLPAGRFSAIAVDPVTHLAVVGQEAGAGVAFVDLAQAARGVASVRVFTMPDTPDATGWVLRADPHGVQTGTIAGKPYAFLASGLRTWVARIDLAAVAALADGDEAGFSAAVAYVAVPVPPPLTPP